MTEQERLQPRSPGKPNPRYAGHPRRRAGGSEFTSPTIKLAKFSQESCRIHLSTGCAAGRAASVQEIHRQRTRARHPPIRLNAFPAAYTWVATIFDSFRSAVARQASRLRFRHRVQRHDSWISGRSHAPVMARRSMVISDRSRVSEGFGANATNELAAAALNPRPVGRRRSGLSLCITDAPSPSRWFQFAAGRPRISAVRRSSTKVPLTEIGREYLVHIDVDAVDQGTWVGRGDNLSLIKHSRRFTLTMRPRLRLPCPPIAWSG